MNIVAVNYSHDSSVAFLSDGALIFAQAEERISELKCCAGWPVETLDYLFKNFIDIRDVDCFALVGMNGKPEWEKTTFHLLENSRVNLDDLYTKALIKARKKKHTSAVGMYVGIVETISAYLSNRYGCVPPIRFVDHHTAHAYCARIGVTGERSNLVTLDGEGDGLCATVGTSTGSDYSRSSEYSSDLSPGYIYGLATKLCGFTPNRHEGKLVGLAAHYYGKDVTEDSLYLFDKGFKLVRRHDKLPLHEDIANNANELLFRCKDIKEFSFHMQRNLERSVIDLIKSSIEGNDKALGVAGGVFANVALNSAIARAGVCRRLYVYHDMGDSGLPVGAALEIFERHTKQHLRVSSSPYLGSSYTSADFDRLLREDRGTYRVITSQRPHRYLSDAIQGGLLVGLFHGRMEQGPRALCNRSILAAPWKHDINATLNERLNRSDFMPFAPVILGGHEDTYILGERNIFEDCLRTMTITCRATERAKREAPAVVHVDGTFRPQVIYDETHVAYRILQDLAKVGYPPILINTSFNAHEHPIVESPKRALTYLRRGIIDVLYAEGLVIERAS